MLLALRFSRLITKLSFPRRSYPEFSMKQTKINNFFVKRSSGTDASPTKSVDRKKTTAEDSDDEGKGRGKKSSPVVNAKKSQVMKNGRKRAIIYSDSEDEEPSTIKSPPEEIEQVPEVSPKKLSSEKPPASKDSLKTPAKSKDSRSTPNSSKKNGLSSVKNGRVTKSKKATVKAKKSTPGAKTRGKTNSTSKSDSEEEDSNSDEAMDEPMETEVERSPSKSKRNGISPVEKVKTGKGRKSDSKVKSSPSSAPSKKKSLTKSDAEKEDDSDVDLPKKKEVEKSPKSAEKVVVKSMKLESGQAVKGWNTEYDPSKSKYHPIDDASWSRGQSVPYLALAITLKKIEETSSRLKNIEILSNFFRSVILLSPQDLRFSIYLCLNKLAPAYEGVELGIAETNLIKAIAQSTGRSDKDIKNQLSEKDLGEIAESSRTSQKTLFQPAPLTVASVFSKLKEIAGMTGKASLQKKISMIQSMLVACKYSEARFVVRSLAGKLRIGLAEQSLLQAIAQACYLTPPNQNQADKSIDWPPKKNMINAGSSLHADEIKARAEKVAFKVKSCYCECPNYDILVDALLKDGVDGLEEYCKLTPGIPPRPMLAQPTKGVEDILHRFTDIKFTCEYKYDGERAQIHLLEDGRVEIYSRNQENNTLKFPDIVNRFKDCIGSNITSCILDSEAVAWDREKETILPFQVLSTRKRKDANEAEIKVQVIIYGFDLIYLNGDSLVKEPLVKRRELLKENFTVIPGQFEFAKSVDTDSMEQVQEFLEESIKGNCEGLMVKTLDVNASYELAKRSHKWLKLKKDYLNTGGDSLDLVVIGGFLGKGKRTGTYGAYLLACYDPDNEEFQTICKLGTGFSDEDLDKHTKTLEGHKIPKPKPYYQFHSNLTPDHWFDSAVVWEVKCADLSLSPVHKAAAGLEDPERGISLRFPRFIRIRDDKNPEDATSASQVAQMYKNQDVVKNAGGGARDFEDEFY